MPPSAKLALGLLCLAALSACGGSQATAPATEGVATSTESPAAVIASPAPSLTPTTTPPPAGTPTRGLEQAHLVGETYPDGTPLAPGEHFTKTWTFENSGETVWGADYQVVFFASPQGETLGAVESVPLGQAVAPGEQVGVSVSLTAPLKAGTYTVVWQLINENGDSIEVDGGNFWVTIRVPGTAAGGSTNASANQVTVTLSALDTGQSSTRAELCFDFPPGNDWFPQQIYLLASGETYDSSGGSLGTYPFSCFYSVFPVGAGELAGYASYQISVGKIGVLGPLNDQIGKCESVKAELQAQHPGLDFTCQPFTSGIYFSDLVVPAGVGRQEMETIIVDAMHDTIYGPWVITITP